MKISSSAYLWSPVRQQVVDPPPTAPPDPPAQFLKSSRSLRRDALLATASLSTLVLSRPAARLTGGVVGGLGLVASYGEIREGMRRQDFHEVIGGALHMGSSAAMLASGLAGGGVMSGLLTASSLTLLTAKTLYDRPADVADLLFRQPLELGADAARTIWHETFSGDEPK